jgi:hypothetical protein
VKQIRERLTYANVMSTIAVFLLLAGATAFAASQLAKNSVGSKQLKPNSVTTAKIKKNAVTTAKIKKNAITTAKIKKNAVTGEKINAETTPFARVVAKLRGSSPLALNETFQVYPLSPSTYTQAPEEDDDYVGAVDVTFEPTCTPPRSATAFISLDAANPTTKEAEEIEHLVSLGVAIDKTGGTVTKRIQVGPYLFLGSRFEPGTSTTHTVSLIVEGSCEAGTGIKATTGAVDVIGVK